ncbi:MAG TPA: MBL fold metallo-hydrolase [Solibacterales bacterium]|nr:MBL fold metallo-hydrolase [Bryobacterales bacterium]
MKLTVLGSGTSAGVPTIGCRCAVCTSADPRDNRMRPSIVVSHEGRNILIDTTPDFRTQALRSNLDRVDAILFTHSHADHILGLDDVRPFNYMQGAPIPIYAATDTLETIRRIFSYVFEDAPRQTHVPKLEVHVVDGSPFELFGLQVQPIPLVHGNQMIYGYRIGPLAYMTDHSEIPPASKAMLRDLDVLFHDALRRTPHPTHSTVDDALRNIEELRPKRAFFTHICHDLGHAATEASLPPNVHLAYDGMQLEMPAA